jgi:hypothetical protein
MRSFSYPLYDFKIKQENEKEFIFDVIRKQWIRLTPEEWVRQNFIQYLIQTKQYPASLISVEKELLLGDVKKRYDIVVYKNSKPWMAIECKEMNVQLNEKTAEQLFIYNQSLNVEYLIITNGNNTYGLHTATHQQLNVIPDYN